MPPVGPVAGVLLATVIAPTEAPPPDLTAVGRVKAIGREFVMLILATAGAVGGTTFTLTNGGFEFAQAKACCLVSKNLSITSALRSFTLRPDRRAAWRFRPALPVSTAASVEPSGITTRLP